MYLFQTLPKISRNLIPYNLKNVIIEKMCYEILYLESGLESSCCDNLLEKKFVFKSCLKIKQIQKMLEVVKIGFF